MKGNRERMAVRPTLEVCIDDAAGLAACHALPPRDRPDRIELCSALALGGLTPSRGLMQAAGRGSIPAYAMIRPRAGDFRFDADEVAVMLNDIATARAAGLHGVVLGAEAADGTLDAHVLAQLCAGARGLGRTLHRVIDLTPDPLAAIDTAVALGFDRILSSGAAGDALSGQTILARMRAHAGTRIEIMAGAGITAENVADLAAATGLAAFHASCSRAHPAEPGLHAFGFAPAGLRRTDPGAIATLKAALRRL